MKKIIIDCDPGHDDAIAICLALAHENYLHIEGITTVAGNQTLDKVTKNALRIVDILSSDIKVYKGASKPLVKDLITGGDAHGETGMDGPQLAEPTRSFERISALEFMANTLKHSDEPVTLVALGPLTNIAMLITNYPDQLHKIKEISLMGGGIDFGNITPAAEFNFYVDPEAADIVFKSNIPIVMSGLDVTEKAYMLKEEFQVLKEGHQVSKFVYDLLVFYFKYSEKHGLIGSSIHDACSVMYLIKPELFTFEMHDVAIAKEEGIARGMSIADRRPFAREHKNIKVLWDVDRLEFVEYLLTSILSLDKTK